MDPGIILRGAENVQKHSFPVVPMLFRVGHSPDPKFDYIICPILVKNRFNGHHRPLANPSVQFLLSDRPFCHISHQPLPIRVHKAPRSIEEPPDDVSGACVKAFTRDFLGLIKPVFVNVSVPVFSPSPIL